MTYNLFKGTVSLSLLFAVQKWDGTEKPKDCQIDLFIADEAIITFGKCLSAVVRDALRFRGGGVVSHVAGVGYFSSQKHSDPLAIESRELRGISQRMGEIMFVFFSHRFPPDVQSWSKGGTRAAACD